MKIILLSIYCCFFMHYVSVAQESFNSAGGTVSAASGSASYTIGQMNYSFSTTAEGSNNEGIQQPFEIATTGINKAFLADFSMKVYPNPSSSFIILSVSKLPQDQLIYFLYDFTGKELLNNIIKDEKTQIEMSSFATGNYILTVKKSNLEVQTFKIIKNN